MLIIRQFQGLIKGESFRHLRNTSDQTELKPIINDFKTHLKKRVYRFKIEPILREITANTGMK